MKRVVFNIRFLLVVGVAVVAGVWPIAAQAAPPSLPALGTAANFAVLAGSTITNTGATMVTGNLGLSPGSSITGFPPGTASGMHIADAPAVQAKIDLTTAYNTAAGETPTSNLTGQDLGGQTLTSGVYKFNSSAQLTGALSLSGGGVFIFQIGSTLTTGTASAVLLANGAQACSVFWQVGSSATIGAATQFQGNLMALTSITVVAGANIITGRAMAQNGAVTMDTNRITPPTGTCTPGVPGSCHQRAGKDADENADQSKDAADRSESAKNASESSDSSHGDGKDENGKHSEHDGHDGHDGKDGCDSRDSNKDHNNDNKDNKKKSND